MSTTSMLMPFPLASSEWAIARVVIETGDETAFVHSLVSFGVEHYPAGAGRSVVSLERYEGWRESVDDFLASHRGSVELLAHDDCDTSWRLPPEPVPMVPGLDVVSSASGESPSPRVIVLNPGLAFGDCRHPTTRLCAAAIARLVKEAPFTSLLDVGCGSGILALVAARAGVAEVTATDIDPYCRFIAKHNASRNRLAISVVDELPSARFDVVVANIWATAFPTLAAKLEAAVAEGGSLVLSGFPTAEGDAVVSCFKNMQNTHVEQGGWCVLTMRRH